MSLTISFDDGAVVIQVRTPEEAGREIGRRWLGTSTWNAYLYRDGEPASESDHRRALAAALTEVFNA